MDICSFSSYKQTLVAALVVTTIWQFTLSCTASYREGTNNIVSDAKQLLPGVGTRIATDIVDVPTVEQILDLLSQYGGHQDRRRRQASNGEEDSDGDSLAAAGEADYGTQTGYRVASFKEALPPKFGRAYNSTRKLGCYYFDVKKKIPQHSRIHYAVLTIFRRCKNSGQQEVNASLVTDTNSAPRTIHDSVNISCEGRSGGDWLRLIVTPFVKQWFSNQEGEEHRSLCLIGSRVDKSPRMSLFSLQAGNIKAGKNRNASLTVIYELGVLGDQPTCVPVVNENIASGQTCCRKAYYVDFKQSQWRDNILFPSGYDAYSCHGWCPRVQSQKLPHFSIGAVARWFTLVHRQCRPTTYSAVTIMLRDNHGRLHLESIPNTVVLACGCGK